MPSYIPWSQVNFDSWHGGDYAPQPVPREADSTSIFADFSRRYEASFEGHVSTPDERLPPACHGRGQIVAPQSREAVFPTLRPSRPGEVRQPTDFLGRTAQRWFLQLRRLQSMRHALRAGKMTEDAILYRLELWKAILRAQRYGMGFASWWKNRPVQLQGSPEVLPAWVPGLDMCERIFDDYQVNYKKLEGWHVRQRQSLLDVTLQTQRSRIFRLTRPEGKSSLSHLEDTKEVTVLAQSDSGEQLHVSEALLVKPPFQVDADGMNLGATQIDRDIINIAPDYLITPGTQVEVTQHYSTPPELHEALAHYWQSRWWKESLLPADAWDRIFSFAQAYLPRSTCPCSPIAIDDWVQINARYKTTAARGPDGYSAKDLQWMPRGLAEDLVNQLNHWESTSTWPRSLLTGFVHPLPKREHSVQVGDFRPVIVYSTIYRSWSSLRARGILQFLSSLVDEHQFGFLPGCEAAEIWFLLQGLLENAHQTQTFYNGFVTDLVKAFESLPRYPVRALCELIGLPRSVLDLWHNFLHNMERRFRLGDTVGPALISNTGYPEGCALSCVAMAVVDLSYHIYMRIYSPSAVSLSFVDNLELVDNSLATLTSSIVALRTWADMWHLELDTKKTYTWSTTADGRNALQCLGWEVRESAKDLGAQMTYGRRKSVKEQQIRLDALEPYWYLLTRTIAPDFSKMMVLFQAMWPRAFHGISVCTLGWSHVVHLRSAAMIKSTTFQQGRQPCRSSTSIALNFPAL